MKPVGRCLVQVHIHLKARIAVIHPVHIPVVFLFPVRMFVKITFSFLLIQVVKKRLGFLVITTCIICSAARILHPLRRFQGPALRESINPVVQDQLPQVHASVLMEVVPFPVHFPPSPDHCPVFIQVVGPSVCLQPSFL